MRPTRVEYERAVEDGEAARRAGKPRDSAPWRGGSEKIVLLREAFQYGWDRQDSRNKEQRR